MANLDMSGGNEVLKSVGRMAKHTLKKFEDVIAVSNRTDHKEMVIFSRRPCTFFASLAATPLSCIH